MIASASFGKLRQGIGTGACCTRASEPGRFAEKRKRRIRWFCRRSAVRLTSPDSKTPDEDCRQVFRTAAYPLQGSSAKRRRNTLKRLLRRNGRGREYGGARNSLLTRYGVFERFGMLKASKSPAKDIREAGVG